MVSSKKRGRQEMEASEPQEERPMIERIRNMWEFANLAQWIYIFGKAVKIDESLDIEDLEMECLKSHSTVLADIGLALLKFVSSHRGLTPEIFDEYSRRQYMAKAPQRNPFGVEEEPAKFMDFDVFTKIRVLQQLTQWTMANPDRIRERMEEQKDSDQTFWRIEPFGWDSEDRTYIVLDDNRLYRQTAPPPPPPPPPAPKKNSKKAKAALRASKRRKISEPGATDEEVVGEPVMENKEDVPPEDSGLGGMKWECLAVTLDDLNRFLASIEKSRDPNEKVLRTRIIEDLLPVLEKQEEARKRKVAQKEKELLNLEKLATAKRSSRIAGKLEQQRQEEEAREAERKRQAELAMAKKEQEKWLRLEKERESRMMTREQRLKEREARRILHEEELAGFSEDSKKLEAGEARLSERHLKAEIKKKKQALEQLAEEDDWVFDCICGAYGQVDDGSHSISCEKCNVWQHTKCVGISEAAANRDDFHFICKTCRRRAEEAERVKHRPTIKLKFNRPGSSSSPTSPAQLNGLPANTSPNTNNGAQSPVISSRKENSAYRVSPPRPVYESPYSQPWKLSLKSHSPNANEAIPSSAPLLKVEEKSVNHGLPTSTNRSTGMNGLSYRPNFQAGAYSNGGRAFSPPHLPSPISLPPPPQNRNYTFINGQLPDRRGTIASPSVVQHKVNSHTQSYTLPNATHHEAIDNLYGGPPLPSAQAGPIGQVKNETEKSPLAHTGHPLSSEQARLDGQPKTAVHKSQLVGVGQAGNEQQPSHAGQLQYQAHNTILSTPTASNIPAHLPLSGVSGMSYSSSMGESTESGKQLTKPPSAQRNLLNSPPPGEPRGLYLNSEPSHTSALPPHITGISPTKHSTPRPTIANGITSFSLATPSVLPPAAPLSPSPQQPNLTPPVKSAEPDRNRLSSPFTRPISANGPLTFDTIRPSILPLVAYPSASTQQLDTTPPVKSPQPEKSTPSS